jgi:catechol 2,3-dioxygenase-like lactoylglutathione lyase family enzyme
MAATTTTTHITQLGLVVVPVTDQDRALEFYVGALGFEKRLDVPYGGGDRWLSVAPPGAETDIAIVPPPAGNPIGIDTGIALNSEDIDADHAALRDRGVDVDEEVMRMGDPIPPMFFFRDPDGNKLFIFQPT